MSNSDHQDNHHHHGIDDAQLRQWVTLYRMGRTTQLLGLAIASASAFLFLPVVDATLAFSWLGVYVALALLRLIYTQKFLNRQPFIRDLSPWKHGYVIGTALSGLIWGVTIFVYQVDWPGPYQVYMFLIYAGLISAAASVYAASLPSFAVFTSLVLGPVFIKLAFGDFPGSDEIALLVLLYGCIMYFIAHSIHERIRSLSGLQLSNTELLDHLDEINADLDMEAEQRSVVEQTLWRERKLFLDGPVVVFRWRNTAGWPIEYVSPNVRQFNLDPGTLRNESVPYARFIHPQDLSLVDKAAPIDGLDTKHPALRKDYRLMLPNGEVRWVHDHTVPVFDAYDEVSHYDGYILDITDRKIAEQSVLAEKERIQVTLHSIGDGVITTDSEHSITYMNPAAETITGFSLTDALQKKLADVFRMDGGLQRSLQESADGGASKSQVQRSGRLRGTDGSVRDVNYGVSPIKDLEGNRIGLVLVFHDASESMAMSRELAYYASHDSLTGALNRRAFESRLETALGTARQNDVRHSLIYIDLDQFKVINDSYGHRAGDRFLLQVSDGLAQILQKPDELARLGGDEFAVLVYDCPGNRARGTAEKLKNHIHAIRYQWENRIFTVSASIGIAEINSKSESVEQILSAADMACYAAKDAGRNRIQIYRESDMQIRRRQSDMEWISRIQSAIENDRLLLYSQKIGSVLTPDEPVTRQEILIRLIDEKGGLIPASTFLPAAERYNLSPVIDRWVVRQCLQSIRSFPENQNSIYFINVSGISLSQQDFLRHIKTQFEEFGIAGRQVCFEITETAAISNLRYAVKFVTELKSMGCHFALDDFGSGLSSFAYLKELSVDYLKIDGSFVLNIVEDTLDHALVEAINQVGHVMLIDTIAEHVESAMVFEAVKNIGIDYAQGHYIEEPMPLPGQELKLDKLVATHT